MKTRNVAASGFLRGWVNTHVTIVEMSLCATVDTEGFWISLTDFHEKMWTGWQLARYPSACRVQLYGPLKVVGKMASISSAEPKETGTLFWEKQQVAGEQRVYLRTCLNVYSAFTFEQVFTRRNKWIVFLTVLKLWLDQWKDRKWFDYSLLYDFTW